MAGVDFSDFDAAVKWLETQSVEVRCAISSRAALRVCANIGWRKGDSERTLALMSFRATLTSAVRGLGRTADVDWLSEAARSAADSALSAADTAHSAALSARSAAESALSAADSAHSAARSATSIDAQNAEIADYEKALWGTLEVPKTIGENHIAFLKGLAKDPETWGFWHDWYLGMWDGEFRDWDLATEVARIPDEIWDQGAEAVGAEIDKIIDNIRARTSLEKEIADLKDALKQAKTFEVLPNRHHNNPPPEAMIEDQRSLDKEITLIWDQLENVEDEIAKPAPNKSILRSIAKTLSDISVRIATYCGSLADIALKESAKVIGGTGTKAGIGLLVTTTAAQNEGVKAVAKAVWEFVKTLPPG